MEHEGSFDWIRECERLEATNKGLLEACKSAYGHLVAYGLNRHDEAFRLCEDALRKAGA